MGKVLDLKVFKPEERHFRLLDADGKEVKKIDVSRVPTDAVISVLDNVDLLAKMQKGEVSREAFDMLLDVAVKTCQANDEEITKDYLLEALDVFGLVELIMFIIEPVFARMKDEGKKK